MFKSGQINEEKKKTLTEVKHLVAGLSPPLAHRATVWRSTSHFAEDFHDVM